jgi:hypothetical protein
MHSPAQYAFLKARFPEETPTEIHRTLTDHSGVENLEAAVQYLRRGRDLPPEAILDALSATFPSAPRLSPHALASKA